MAGRIDTILIIGAAGGIGEAMARRFHSLGKKLIVTGREQDKARINALAKELPGADVVTWDITRLDQLENQVTAILSDYPKLDSVFVNAGIQLHYDIFQECVGQSTILNELTTNLLAPVLIAQAFSPHLLAMAESGQKTNLFLTSSSLAYFPVPFYPTYCAAKAGVAAYIKIIRMQLQRTKCKDMSVVEVVPPYVDTPLNAAHRSQTDALQGGSKKAVQPMPLMDYIDEFFASLENIKSNGSFSDEVGVGFGRRGAEIWHEGYTKMLDASGMPD